MPEVPGPNEERSGWLGSFLDGLGLRRVSLLGDGEGAATAVHFALEEPERVERLVMVGVDGLLDRRPRSGFRQLELPTLIARGGTPGPSDAGPAEAVVRVQVCFLPGAGPRPFEDQPLAFSAAAMQFLGGSNSAAAAAEAVR